jgi:hypothetical protein
MANIYKKFIFIMVLGIALSLKASELHIEGISYLTGFNKQKISEEKARIISDALIDRDEVLGYCIKGSLALNKGSFKEARECYSYAYEGGDLLKYSNFEPYIAHYFLGIYFMLVEPVDYVSANDHFKKSSDLKFGPAMASYGINLILGNGTLKNESLGVNYLIEGMREDCPACYYNYANYLLSIREERKMTAKAYLEYALSRGFQMAAVSLNKYFKE